MKRRAIILLALLLAAALIPQTAFAAKQKYTRSEVYPVRVTALPVDAGSASINGTVYTSKDQPSITINSEDGKTLTLSAKGNAGWTFKGWHLDSTGGELISSELECQYVFKAPADTKKQPVTDIVASFEWTGLPAVYQRIIDLNGGKLIGGLKLYEDVKDTESVSFDYDPKQIEPPEGKVYSYVTLNGDPYRDGANCPVTGNMTFKLYWEDAPQPEKEEPVYSMSKSPEKIDFKDAFEGMYDDIEEQPITVRNEGNMPLMIEADEESSCFEFTFDEVELQPGEYANFMVKPREGLGAGHYSGAAVFSASDPDSGELKIEAQTSLEFTVNALPKDELIPFDDVLPEDYFAEAVHWAYFSEPQVTNGVSKDLFGPDATCTRGQVVTFLWRAAGCPEPGSSKNPFKDVKAGSYYEKAVLWAVEKGITNGTSDDEFSPDATCKYEHIITFLYRFAGEPGKGSAAAVAAQYGGGAAWYSDAQNWAVATGDMLRNTGFSVGKDCPRKDVVQFLYYYMNFVKE